MFYLQLLLLGSGSSGIVELAWDTQADKPVAIKYLLRGKEVRQMYSAYYFATALRADSPLL